LGVRVSGHGVIGIHVFDVLHSDILRWGVVIAVIIVHGNWVVLMRLSLQE